MGATTTEKLKRSVKLTTAQVKYLERAKAKYPTATEAAIELKINRDVLERAIILGSCSEKTYKKLFEA